MTTIECILDWLGEISPLLDAMTALGTLGAVIVALYLGLRRPRTRLAVSLTIRPRAPGVYPAISVSVVNMTEDTPMVSAFFYEIPNVTPSRVFLHGAFITINNQQVGLLPQRLTKEDSMDAILMLEDLGKSVDEFLRKGESEMALLKQLRPMRIGCITATGKQFSTPLLDGAAVELAREVFTHRQAPAPA